MPEQMNEFQPSADRTEATPFQNGDQLNFHGDTSPHLRNLSEIRLSEQAVEASFRSQVDEPGQSEVLTSLSVAGAAAETREITSWRRYIHDSQIDLYDSEAA